MNNVYRFLGGVEGVERMGFDPQTDAFVVDYVGSSATVEAIKSAILISVVGKSLRKALGKLG